VVVLTSIAWRARVGRAEAGVTLEVRADAIVALKADRTERWRYPFPPGQQAYMIPEYAGHRNPIVTSEGPALLASLSGRFVDGRASSGEIFWFSPGGDLRRTFAFEDRLTFSGTVYGEPWNLTDVQVEEG